MQERILKVATKAFATRGYEGASLGSIAEEVGIKKPSLLYHFASKEELHRAVLGSIVLRWNDVLPRVLAAVTGGENRFEVVTNELVTFFGDDPDRARLVARELIDRPAETRLLIGTHVRPWISLFADYVRRGQENGIVRSDVDPEAYVANVMLSIITGVAAIGAAESMMRDPASTGASEKERFLREIVRSAKASLFLAAPAEKKEAAQPSKRKKKGSSRGQLLSRQR